MLQLRDLDVLIESVQVLRGLSLTLEPGSTVALIGRNGAGKTSTLRAIMGLLKPSAGSMTVDGQDLDRLEPSRRAGLGLGFAPEDRRLFGPFTVEENIVFPGQVARLPRNDIHDRLHLIYRIMPELEGLKTRRAGTLSGGQGKMVALGRALMMGRRYVLLDEPFQGLAPALAQRYAEALSQLRQEDTELGILITESNPDLLKAICERTYVVERGAIVSQSGAMAGSDGL